MAFSPRPYLPTLAVMGGRMLARRRELQWTQERAADEMSMHVSYYGRIERGRLDIRLRTLTRAADGLGLDPGHLLSPAPEMDPGYLVDDPRLGPPMRLAQVGLLPRWVPRRGRPRSGGHG